MVGVLSLDEAHASPCLQCGSEQPHSSKEERAANYLSSPFQRLEQQHLTLLGCCMRQANQKNTTLRVCPACGLSSALNRRWESQGDCCL